MMNVWDIIWRNNKGIIQGTLAGTPLENVAVVARQAFLVARTNFFLSLPLSLERTVSLVELDNIQQSRKTERVEVSDGKSGLQGGTIRQSPRSVGTASGLRRKVRPYVPMAQSSKPYRASLPLLPDHGSQPAPNPFFQPLQHRGRLAVVEVTLPAS